MRRFAKVTLLLSMTIVGAAAVEASEGDASFAADVAPVLADRCASCHNPDKSEGGLDVTSRAALLRGGDSGPAIVPGEPEESWLLEMISGDEPEMPKGAQALGVEQVDAVREWISTGAPWPDEVQVAAKLWSLRPIADPPVPSVGRPEWAKTPIDAFILRRLEHEGLAPSPQANRLTLIRRATFDLHGLPPTPEEIDAFLADDSPNAFATVVDRLLRSPRYGERWGRHWLDLASYADSHGFELDYPRPNAWRYRDYVIESFNADKPYDKFLHEQIAGDVLAPGDPNGVVATGFLAAGPWDYSGFITAIQGTAASRGTRLQDLDNMLTTVTTTTVGLTVGCAKCHDHKFDPISQKDYYGLQSVFAGVRRGDRALQSRLSDEQASRMASLRLDIHKKRIGIAEIDARPAAERTDEMAANRAKLVEEIERLEAEYATFPAVELTYAVVPEEAPPVHLLLRGDTESPGEEVAPAALSAVESLPVQLTDADAPEGERRLALARWLTDPANPLTARVVVNRIWRDHLGQGLVATPGDFGFNGERPSHPELLDWLATEFRRGDWSMKRLHRLIMLSSAYQQASEHNEQAASVDAGNRLLWRMNRRRMEAEVVRDSVLAVSGGLDLTMGGPADMTFRYQFRKSPIYDYFSPEESPQTTRRSVYNFIARSTPDPFMNAFDFPVPTECAPARSSTTTPLQSLSLLNDPFLLRESERFAKRLESSYPDDPQSQVTAAYRSAFGREPTARERERAAKFVRERTLFHFCRAMLNANEFVYVD